MIFNILNKVKLECFTIIVLILKAKRLLKEERLKQDYMAGEAAQSKEQVNLYHYLFLTLILFLANICL